jgi:hypothetical protein
VGTRHLFCRHHVCELEIRLHHPYHFCNRDYAVFDCGGVAHTEDKLSFGWETAGPILGGSLSGENHKKRKSAGRVVLAPLSVVLQFGSF